MLNSEHVSAVPLVAHSGDDRGNPRADSVPPRSTEFQREAIDRGREVSAAYNTFNVQRHLTSAKTHRAFRATAMQTWRDVVAAA